MQLTSVKRDVFRKLDFETNQEEIWSARIKRAVRFADLEIIMMEKGYRQAATTQISGAQYEQALENFERRGLIFKPIRWVKKMYGCGHLHVKSTPDAPDAMCYGVLSRDKSVAEEFCAIEQMPPPVNHKRLGQLLGFPECCLDFFCQHWSAGYIDPIWQQALNTPGVKFGEEFQNGKLVGYSADVEGYPECVAMHRYWGVRVLFHLPCSFKCEATRKLAQNWFKEMDLIDKTVTQDVLSVLSLPSTWSALNNHCVVYTPYFKGHANSVPCLDMHTVNFVSVAGTN